MTAPQSPADGAPWFTRQPARGARAAAPDRVNEEGFRLPVLGDHAGKPCACEIRAGESRHHEALQHPPEAIPELVVELMNEEHDVVYGTPARETHGWWRNVASVGMKRVFESALGMKNVAGSSAFRAIRRDALAPFESYENAYVDIDALLSWVTTRFGTVKVAHVDREHGASNYNFFKLVRYSLNLITSFTAVPLHVTSFIGGFFTLLGVGPE